MKTAILLFGAAVVVLLVLVPESEQQSTKQQSTTSAPVANQKPRKPVKGDKKGKSASGKKVGKVGKLRASNWRSVKGKKVSGWNSNDLKSKFIQKYIFTSYILSIIYS